MLIMLVLNHFKNAQAVSFAQYPMAYVEMFKRDKDRQSNLKFK